MPIYTTAARTMGALLLATSAGPLAAQVPPPQAIRMARMPAPSPDGREVAFSYQGDLWVAAATGGEARRLTAHPAYETRPVWSPDGSLIAFSSDREGNDDVYVIPVKGGEVRRLTHHSDADRPVDWTPDGRCVLFESVRHLNDAGDAGIWMVAAEGGAALPVLPVAAGQGKLSPDGTTLAFVRGSATWWRRGYEGSAKNLLWLHDEGRALSYESWRNPPEVADLDAQARAERGRTSIGAYVDAAVWQSANSRELPASDEEPGNRQNPLWLPDGKHLVYLAEAAGVVNARLLDLETGDSRQLTAYSGERVRHPALARNGSLLALEVEDRIDLVRLNGPAGTASKPAPLEIVLPVDTTSPRLERVAIAGSASEMALSPDGKQIAFVARGEIWVMRANKEATFANRVTDHPARDWQIAWDDDSKSIVFVSDRDGDRDLYRVRSADEKEARLARALTFKVEQITNDPKEETDPRISPDGKLIAFQRGLGDLMVMKADGSDPRRLVEGWSNLEIRWSPDSKWLAYSQEDADYNSEIWILSADGKAGPHNVSMHPDVDRTPSWSPDGKLLLWTSQRRFLNQVDLWYVRLDRTDEDRWSQDRVDEWYEDADAPLAEVARGLDEAKRKGHGGSGSKEDKDDDSTAVTVRIDFEDLYLRAHRLTAFSGSEGEALVSKDGKEIAFVADVEDKRDLWKVKWDGTEPKRITSGGTNPSQLQWNPKKSAIFFLKQGGGIASVGLDGGEVTTFPYDGEIAIDRLAERGVVFEEAWRELRDNFYDAKWHGADWPGLHAKYRSWAEAASTQRDFQDVLRLMMGELNASHLETWDGPRDFAAPAFPATTGELGVVFAARSERAGLTVARVVPRSPADRDESRLAPGDRIVSINDQTISRDVDPSEFLDRTVDRRVRLGVIDPGGKTREVTIRPIARAAFRDLLYQENLALRRAEVERLSAGRVGYLHIAGMGAGNLDTFERDLFAVAHDKDALIIDVRDNGGGWITDLLLASLMAPDHATTVGRDGKSGYPQDRRIFYAWTRPIVVLCDENSYSNAEIFAQAIKTLGRGPIVGRTTYGAVISTGGTTLANGAWLRLPFRGWYTKEDGTNLERRGCIPDLTVVNQPNDLVRGFDAQLARGVERALEQLR